MSKMKFSKISKILKDAKRGKMFILVDDEQRVNEGDLITFEVDTGEKGPSAVNLQKA